MQLQVKRISGMLADLSDAGGSPEEFGEEADLAEVVGRVVAASDGILAERSLTVETDIPADLPPLRVNRAKFDRLFELFVRDEVASLSEGKTIRISARTETLEDAPWVSVRIEDDGSGLPEEELRRLFNPFYVRSDDPKEFGVNLMTCYFIVYHHGGRVDVQNSENGGVIFILSFPLEAAATPAAREDEEFISKVLANEALWDRLLAGI